MWLGVLLTLVLCPSLEGQEKSFTINRVHMVILPDLTVASGTNLTLQCVVDVSTTSHVTPERRVLFYKDDVLLHNASSAGPVESYSVPRARVHNAGTYKCTVVLNSKLKTSPDYKVLVKGVSSPKVTLDKKEVVEGGVVMVTCSVPEERAPVHFTIEKVALETKAVSQQKEKSSLSHNFVTLEFTVQEGDRVIYFLCQASISSGKQMESSQPARSDLVTVWEYFSNPKFSVSPKGPITEGDQLNITCAIQVAHNALPFPEIIIQKDKVIVTNSRNGHLASYAVMALVDHSGNYTCKVETNRISKVSSIVVNITELFSTPKLEASATPLNHGDSLKLWCSAPGVPAANFTIQKADVVVSWTQNFSKDASERDTGTYTCHAGVGKVVKTSNKVQITVCGKLSKPRIFYDSKSEVVKGRTIEVSCQSVNGTAPISYRLLKAPDIFQHSTVGSHEPAVFRDSPAEDTVYQCVADNCHSDPEIYSDPLLVKVIAPVDEVRLSSINNEIADSGEELVLRCSVNNASAPITYRFYKGKEVRPLHEAESDRTEVFWYKTDISRQQEGQYYCTATNRANPPGSVPRSNVLTVRVFLAPWKKGLIAGAVIGAIVALFVLAARCYLQRRAKAKQMPVEMSRTAVPLLTPSDEKMPDSSPEANRPYGYNEDIGNHATLPISENKEPLTLDVEYTEVEVTSAGPHEGLGRRGTETVYSEIRKANPGERQPRAQARPDPHSHNLPGLNSHKLPDVSDDTDTF